MIGMEGRQFRLCGQCVLRLSRQRMCAKLDRQLSKLVSPAELGRASGPEGQGRVGLTRQAGSTCSISSPSRVLTGHVVNATRVKHALLVALQSRLGIHYRLGRKYKKNRQ